MSIRTQNSFLKQLSHPEKQLKSILEEQQLMTNLNQEEQEILDSYENDEWYSVGTPERLAELQSYAEATLTQDKKVTLHLSSVDLEAIQAKAIEEEIPYQTLISSILHRYVTGLLVESPK